VIAVIAVMVGVTAAASGGRQVGVGHGRSTSLSTCVGCLSGGHHRCLESCVELDLKDMHESVDLINDTNEWIDKAQAVFSF